MRRTLLLLSLGLAASPLAAQEHRHTEGMVHTPGMTPAAAPAALPALPGQDAYGAIAEVVRLLEADSTTDWSRVNLEALRQHLIDMNEVTLRAAVRATPVQGGLRMDVTGTGRTRGAIRAMLSAHTPTLDASADYVATVEEIPGGARLIVRAERSGDEPTAVRIRGLGFIGLLTAGAHHAPHHLALARGEPMAHSH